MKAGRRHAALAASIGALVLAAGLGAAPTAFAAPAAEAPALSSLKVLSARDLRAYSSAFDATKRGDFDDADDAAARIDDTLLMGRLAYAKLMHPVYVAKFDELKAWLKTYREQPDADRVYTLAKKRLPTAQTKTAKLTPTSALDSFRADLGADTTLDAPPAPTVDPTWARVETQAERIEAKKLDAVATKTKVDPKLQASREAFYAGDVEKAYTLATAAGEQWIAGLAAFRKERYAEAVRRFDTLSTDGSQNEWVRSAAAYWAARAATASGEPDKAPEFLERAAKTPYTFYGLIAERQLGLDAAVTADGLDLGDEDSAASPAQPLKALLVTGEAGEAVARLVKKDPRARRAAAYAQLGMKTEAGAELRTALMGAAGNEARKTWANLALALNAPITSPADLARSGGRNRFDLAQYPMPDLDPNGGFTLDKALVYALVRQESKFNAAAVSSAGAHGLMQLMPETAARVAGDPKSNFDPAALHDPAVNLRIGQDYVAKLLSGADGDLLKAVAAYNIGPVAIQKLVARMGDADSLLTIESMQGAQTREFVEKVVAGYWIYRNLFGQASPSLDAAASASKAVRAAVDR